MDLDEAQIVTITGISKPTLIKFKDAFSLKIRDEYCDNIKKIGGLGYIIQIDETVICRGRIIQYLTQYYDTISGSQWMVDVIDQNTKQFYIALIIDITIQSTVEFLNDCVVSDSIIVSG
ncbi:hypothetical protein CDIK_3765 [Cucumispora dikerogammari]|nr:hypothetical protein CDIK_3765 [Cucumispora dikerogammari]